MPDGMVQFADGRAAVGAKVFLDVTDRVSRTTSSELRSLVEEVTGVSTPRHASPTRAGQSGLLVSHVGADGRYSLELPACALLESDRIAVWAELGDLASPVARIHPSGRELELPVLVLAKAVRPRVRIETLDGAPIAQAYVAVILFMEGELVEGDHPEDVLTGRTDADGSVTWHAVPDRPGDWRMWIRVKPDNMPWHLETAHSPREFARGPLLIRVSPGCNVRGRVRLPESRTGGAVRIAVRADGQSLNPDVECFTEAEEDGSFEVRGVPTGGAILEFVEFPPREAGIRARLLDLDRAKSARATRRVSGTVGETIEIGTVRLK